MFCKNNIFFSINSYTYHHDSFPILGTFAVYSIDTDYDWLDRQHIACYGGTDNLPRNSESVERIPCSLHRWWHRNGRPMICRHKLCKVLFQFELQWKKLIINKKIKESGSIFKMPTFQFFFVKTLCQFNNISFWGKVHWNHYNRPKFLLISI